MGLSVLRKISIIIPTNKKVGGVGQKPQLAKAQWAPEEQKVLVINQIQNNAQLQAITAILPYVLNHHHHSLKYIYIYTHSYIY